jgi:hypothetical protein
VPPAKTTTPQTGLPIGDMQTVRTADHRDQMPTQGAGSAAGEVGDSATRAAFISGAPIHDGKAITPPAEGEPAEQPATAAPAAEQPAQPVEPKQDDGPGPVNAAGQRVPVSFDPQNADEMYRYAQMLCRSTLLPRGFYDRDDKAKRYPRIGDVHFVLMKGQALGLHPMVSIGNINIIEGKAEIGASLMVSLCLRSGLCAYFDLIKSDERSATFATKRIGGRREIEFTYTIEEAELMGLLDKGKDEWAKANNQWRKQPRTMLRRRCQSALAREVFPDVVMGLYDHDELGEMRDRELALGLNPDRTIDARETPAALPEGAGPGAIEQMLSRAAVDPLKARMLARQASKAVVGPARCSLCDAVLDPRDTDPCIVCRTPGPAA